MNKGGTSGQVCALRSSCNVYKVHTSRRTNFEKAVNSIYRNGAGCADLSIRLVLYSRSWESVPLRPAICTADPGGSRRQHPCHTSVSCMHDTRSRPHLRLLLLIHSSTDSSSKRSR